MQRVRCLKQSGSSLCYGCYLIVIKNLGYQSSCSYKIAHSYFQLHNELELIVIKEKKKVRKRGRIAPLAILLSTGTRLLQILLSGQKAMNFF